jgi:ABC-2 type transport system permease protein
VWAIGRAAGAITGEIDRGTMELLLAQPLTRTQIVLAHLAVDLVAIPILCVAMWGGTLLGVAWFGELVSGSTGTAVGMQVDPRIYLPALPNTAALVFALSGTTLWLSARGRFRARVLGVAVLLTLLQFLVNLIGQLWPAVAPFRPFTLFFYYQPQQIILENRWQVDVGPLWQLSKPLELNVLIVLIAVGALGYAMALWTFSRRDVPAPL